MPLFMKDSGVPWIGQIPKTWKVCPLKTSITWKSEKNHADATVLSLYRDYGIVPKDSRDDNFNVTSLDTSGYKYVEVGDLVINKMKAWQGSIAVSDYEGIVSPAYHVCQITNNNIYKRYLHYLLRNVSYLPEYMRLSTGLRIGQWDLGFDDFRNIPIILPDVDEQKRIVSFLDEECDHIDAVIEQTRASIEEYKKLKQAVITQAVTKGIRHDCPMRETGKIWIGEIPAHWDLMKIKNIILPTKDGIKIGPFGSALTNKTQDKGEYNVYSQANLIASDFSTTKNTIDEETFTNLKAYEVYPNDICLSMMGTIGKCKKVPSDIKRGIMDSHLIKIRLADFIDSRFFEYTYDKDLGGVCFQQMQFDKKGFIMDGLNTSIVKNLYFPVPSYKEQQEIVDYLNEKCMEMDRIIQNKLLFLSELETYKKSLIYEYVTGKKEVPA